MHNVNITKNWINIIEMIENVIGSLEVLMLQHLSYFALQWSFEYLLVIHCYSIWYKFPQRVLRLILMAYYIFYFSGRYPEVHQPEMYYTGLIGPTQGCWFLSTYWCLFCIQFWDWSSRHSSYIILFVEPRLYYVDDACH